MNTNEALTAGRALAASPAWADKPYIIALGVGLLLAALLIAIGITAALELFGAEPKENNMTKEKYQRMCARCPYRFRSVAAPKVWCCDYVNRMDRTRFDMPSLCPRVLCGEVRTAGEGAAS